MHACIENSCKNKNIFTQTEWGEVMRNAKKIEPRYIVEEVAQSEIFYFRPLANDQNWKAVKMMNLREISVVPNETHVFIKYEYDKEATSILIPTKKSTAKRYPLNQLYNSRIELDKEKKKDLEYMCSKGVIPTSYHDFYKSLMLWINI